MEAMEAPVPPPKTDKAPRAPRPTGPSALVHKIVGMTMGERRTYAKAVRAELSERHPEEYQHLLTVLKEPK